MSEDEFVDQYGKQYHIRQVARACYRALHPVGMRTNGPTRVVLDVGYVLRMLNNYKKNDEQHTSHS